MNNDIYYQKYLKYKSKYLNYFKKLGGSDDQKYIEIYIPINQNYDPKFLQMWKELSNDSFLNKEIKFLKIYDQDAFIKKFNIVNVKPNR